MSQTSDLIETLKDGDMILVFRMPDGALRRRAYRSSFQNMRKTLADAFELDKMKADILTVSKQPGPPGPAPKVSIGTVTAAASGSVPKVTNSGTAPDVVLDFAVPSGAPGRDSTAKGDTGPAGTSIWASSGPPSSAGRTDDLCINVLTGDLFRYSTSWTKIGNIKGADGVPKRIERYTGAVVGSAGLAAFTFSDFAAPPLGDVITGWIGVQMVTGAVIATTKGTATAKVMISRATLLLNDSPFGIAPSGTPVVIQLIGN